MAVVQDAYNGLGTDRAGFRCRELTDASDRRESPESLVAFADNAFKEVVAAVGFSTALFDAHASSSAREA